jgi:hypothetical protein
MSSPTAIAVAAVQFVTRQTNGWLPVELADLPDEHCRRVIFSAARLVDAVTEWPHPDRPRHAARPLD